ncbi:hypothetical protein [Catellatospora coxensis]|nr:hypothetical protein [Catellatospora coxensis]
MGSIPGQMFVGALTEFSAEQLADLATNGRALQSDDPWAAATAGAVEGVVDWAGHRSRPGGGAFAGLDGDVGKLDIAGWNGVPAGDKAGGNAQKVRVTGSGNARGDFVLSGRFDPRDGSFTGGVWARGRVASPGGTVLEGGFAGSGRLTGTLDGRIVAARFGGRSDDGSFVADVRVVGGFAGQWGVAGVFVPERGGAPPARPAAAVPAGIGTGIGLPGPLAKPMSAPIVPYVPKTVAPEQAIAMTAASTGPGRVAADPSAGGSPLTAGTRSVESSPAGMDPGSGTPRIDDPGPQSGPQRYEPVADQPGALVPTTLLAVHPEPAVPDPAAAADPVLEQVLRLPRWQEESDCVPRVWEVLRRLGVAGTRAVDDGAGSRGVDDLVRLFGGGWRRGASATLARLEPGELTVVQVETVNDPRHVLIVWRDTEGRLWQVETQAAPASVMASLDHGAVSHGLVDTYTDTATQTPVVLSNPIQLITDEHGRLLRAVPDVGRVAGSKAAVPAGDVMGTDTLVHALLDPPITTAPGMYRRNPHTHARPLVLNAVVARDAFTIDNDTGVLRLKSPLSVDPDGPVHPLATGTDRLLLTTGGVWTADGRMEIAAGTSFRVEEVDQISDASRIPLAGNGTNIPAAAFHYHLGAALAPDRAMATAGLPRSVLWERRFQYVLRGSELRGAGLVYVEGPQAEVLPLVYGVGTLAWVGRIAAEATSDAVMAGWCARLPPGERLAIEVSARSVEGGARAAKMAEGVALVLQRRIVNGLTRWSERHGGAAVPVVEVEFRTVVTGNLRLRGHANDLIAIRRLTAGTGTGQRLPLLLPPSQRVDPLGRVGGFVKTVDFDPQTLAPAPAAVDEIAHVLEGQIRAGLRELRPLPRVTVRISIPWDTAAARRAADQRARGFLRVLAGRLMQLNVGLPQVQEWMKAMPSAAVVLFGLDETNGAIRLEVYSHSLAGRSVVAEQPSGDQVMRVSFEPPTRYQRGGYLWPLDRDIAARTAWTLLAKAEASVQHRHPLPQVTAEVSIPADTAEERRAAHALVYGFLSTVAGHLRIPARASGAVAPWVNTLPATARVVFRVVESVPGRGSSVDLYTSRTAPFPVPAQLRVYFDDEWGWQNRRTVGETSAKRYHQAVIPLGDLILQRDDAHRQGPDFLNYWRTAPDSALTRGWWTVDGPVPAAEIEDAFRSLDPQVSRHVDAPYVEPVDAVGHHGATVVPIYFNPRYDVVRIAFDEPTGLRVVRVFRIRYKLQPGAGVTPADVERMKAAGQSTLAAVNGRYRLPGGDQFHLMIEFVDRGEYHTIMVPHQMPAHRRDLLADVDTWPTALLTDPALRSTILHEMLHNLGLGEDYHDIRWNIPATRPVSVLRSAVAPAPPGSAGRMPRRTDQPGIMGLYVPGFPESGIAVRYLVQIWVVQESQAKAPLVRYDTAARAVVPHPVELRSDALAELDLPERRRALNVFADQMPAMVRHAWHGGERWLVPDRLPVVQIRVPAAVAESSQIAAIRAELVDAVKRVLDRHSLPVDGIVFTVLADDAIPPGVIRVRATLAPVLEAIPGDERRPRG